MASHLEDPPSKKRAAARQISKDDDVDSGDEDAPDMSTGTFRRASDEVLAERRIVKVRRTPAPASSAPNPFASIQLVPPPVPLAQEPLVPPPILFSNATGQSLTSVADEIKPTTVSVVENAKVHSTTEGSFIVDSEAKVDSVVVQEQRIDSKIISFQAKDVDVPAEINEQGIPEDQKTSLDLAGNATSPETHVEIKNAENGNKEESEKPQGGESVGISGASSETFQQLSSATNAFAGSFGTGFSSSPFVFNSSLSAPTASSGFGSYSSPFAFSTQPFGSSVSFGSSTFGSGSTPAGTFPSLSSVFGKSNGSGSGPLFGFSDSVAMVPTSTQQNTSVVSLQEVHVETGEEKEKAVFTADAALFEFLEGAWKERGKGELRVNVSEDKEKRPRLVMRSKGNYRLLLNANLFPDMKLSEMELRGVSFVCANSAAGSKTGLIPYAVKMRDKLVASEFIAVVQAHKGNANTEPKTPESSPKASERPAKVVDSSEVDP